MKKYFLYDSQTKVQHQKLTIDEVANIFNQTLPSARENLYGWYKGQADWLPLREIQEFAFLYSIEPRAEFEDINYDPTEKTQIPTFTGIYNLEKLVETSQITYEKEPTLTITQEIIKPEPVLAPVSNNQVNTSISSPTKQKLELKIKIQPKVSTTQAIPQTQPITSSSVPVNRVTPPESVNSVESNLSLNNISPLTSNPSVQQLTSESQALPEKELTGRERRKFTRYDVKLRVIITNKKNTFLTFTKDVSLGGLQLMNDIPEYIFQGESEVFISGPNNRDNIKFKCKAIGDNQHKSRLQFEDSDQVLLEKLQLWIDHIVKPQVKSA